MNGALNDGGEPQAQLADGLFAQLALGPVALRVLDPSDVPR